MRHDEYPQDESGIRGIELFFPIFLVGLLVIISIPIFASWLGLLKELLIAMALLAVGAALAGMYIYTDRAKKEWRKSQNN